MIFAKAENHNLAVETMFERIKWRANQKICRIYPL